MQTAGQENPVYKQLSLVRPRRYVLHVNEFSCKQHWVNKQYFQFQVAYYKGILRYNKHQEVVVRTCV